MLYVQQVDLERASFLNLSDIENSDSDLGELNMFPNGQQS